MLPLCECCCDFNYHTIKSGNAAIHFKMINEESRVEKERERESSIKIVHLILARHESIEYLINYGREKRTKNSVNCELGLRLRELKCCVFLLCRSVLLISMITLIHVCTRKEIILKDDEGDKQLLLFIVASRVSFFLKPEN